MSSEWTGINHFWAMKVGITALMITTPIRREYWTWLIKPEVRPKTTGNSPKGKPGAHEQGGVHRSLRNISPGQEEHSDEFGDDFQEE